MANWWKQFQSKPKPEPKLESALEFTGSTYTEVEERVREISASNSDLHIDTISAETEFGDIDDSVGNLEIVMECEEVFGVEIPDEEAQDLITVGQLTYYIARKLNIAAQS